VGTGTFGRVRLARFNGNGRYYAMKILKKESLILLRQLEHIRNERRILMSVKHPFIVNLRGSFQDEEHLYMVMDFVPGGELFSHLRRAGRFPLEVTKLYAAEIVLALAYLHERSICYRDLKPENLLLDQDGHLRITDFGFAKHVVDRTYTLCGTPEYLAPEIIQSQGHGLAADWWSLGILIYEMLAGYPPYYDDDPYATYEKILAGRLVFPRHFDRDTRDILRKLLNPDKTRRLGALANGADDVKKHRFFRGLDWGWLERRLVRAPIIPTVRAPNDTRNFDLYDEAQDELPQEVADSVGPPTYTMEQISAMFDEWK
jgi:serine/threonine protein kinase